MIFRNFIIKLLKLDFRYVRIDERINTLQAMINFVEHKSVNKKDILKMLEERIRSDKYIATKGFEGKSHQFKSL